MSALITPEPRILSKPALAAPSTISKPEPSRPPTRVTHMGRQTEAPERAVLSNEEPELVASSDAEAPDAGQGGFDRNDHEFRTRSE